LGNLGDANSGQKSAYLSLPRPTCSQSEISLSKSLIELNLTISALAPEKAILLELVRWETHVPPLIADEPEKVVLDHFGAYDIFVRIMWKGMGTPTTEAQSGTEEEFHRAHEIWQKHRTLPVLFYFCQKSFPPPRTAEELEHLGKVSAFCNERSTKGRVAE